MSDLHVLMLPSFYDTPQKPYDGTFFRDWALAMARAGVTVGVGYVEGRSLRGLSWHALKETHFQTTAGVESGLPTVRLEGWNTAAQWTAGGLIWARLTQRVIREYIERYGRPDLIAAYSATWAGDAAWRAHESRGLPYVITEMMTGFSIGKVRGWEAAISRRAFASAEAVIAISGPLRAALRQFVGDRPVEVIPCTVDERYWTAPPTPRGAGPFTFYAQAHLTPRKGFDILIRAFASRFRGDATCRLVIGGGGAIRGELEALAASSGVASQVTFLGAIPRDEVRDAMWAADCFVLPSLAENFGVVLIEALSTGLPVISTRCGGPEDIITDEVGLLLRPGDEPGLADALWTMRHRPAHAPEGVRAYAVARFGYAAVGARLRDFYRGVLGRRDGDRTLSVERA
jgi:glycosyltransferase involved in cell wall biosynthesis